MKITGIELEEQDILNILTDTLETNAIGYWAQYQTWERIEEKVIDDPRANCVTKINIKELNNDETAWEIPHTITYDTIVTGVRLIVSGEVDNSYIRNMILDDDIDSDGCDCIVQAGLFGEIKYG